MQYVERFIHWFIRSFIHPSIHSFIHVVFIKVVERILYIYAKLNPGIAYVQVSNSLATRQKGNQLMWPWKFFCLCWGSTKASRIPVRSTIVVWRWTKIIVIVMDVIFLFEIGHKFYSGLRYLFFLWLFSFLFSFVIIQWPHPSHHITYASRHDYEVVCWSFIVFWQLCPIYVFKVWISCMQEVHD